MVPPTRTLADRLLDRLDTSGECWLWTGPVERTGYAFLTRGGHQGKRVSVHRASYEVHHGPIPDGMLVLHRCDVRNCARPEHLFLGTYADNVRDMNEKGRGMAGRRRERGPDGKWRWLPDDRLTPPVVSRETEPTDD